MPNAIESAIESLTPELERLWNDKLKELIETKHLYQRVTVDASKVAQELSLGIPSTQAREFGARVREVQEEPLGIAVRGQRP